MQFSPGIDGLAQVPDGRIFATSFQAGTTHPFISRSLDLPMGMAPLADGRLAIADLGSVAYVSGSGAISRPQMFIRGDLDIAIGAAARGDCDVYSTDFSAVSSAMDTFV